MSARLDGEELGVDPGELDDHLERCPECRQWEVTASDVTRRFRVRPANPGPNPSVGALVAAANARHPGWPRPSPLTVGRVALAAVAATEIVLAIPAFVYGRDRGSPVHVAHEMGALDIAMGLGLVVAARRPARAVGLLSTIAAAAALLVVTAVVDLASGRTSLGDEAPHLLVVGGWIALRFVACNAPPEPEASRPGRWRSSLTVPGRRHGRPAVASRGVGPAQPIHGRSGGGSASHVPRRPPPGAPPRRSAG